MVTDCYSQFSPWTCAKWLQDSRKGRRLLPVLKCIEEPKRSKESWESKRPKESPWESFDGSGVCPRREDASGEENATQSSLRLCQCQLFFSPPSFSKNSNFGNENRVGKHWGWAGWECHSSLYLPTSQVRQVVSEVFQFWELEKYGLS